MPLDIETLAHGYGLVEGPRLDSVGNLFFSDVTNGGVHRRAPDGAVTTVVPRRKGVGGIALHAEGGLVISGRDVCHVMDGTTRILLQRPEGVSGFNDLFVDAAGRVLVGSLRSNPFDLGRERETGECWRIDGEGKSVVLYDGVGLGNGIGFSPDGRSLYHSDTAAGAVLAHDVAPDGSVSKRRVFAECDAPDGLAVDAAGGVWVASYATSATSSSPARTTPRSPSAGARSSACARTSRACRPRSRGSSGIEPPLLEAYRDAGKILFQSLGTGCRHLAAANEERMQILQLCQLLDPGIGHLRIAHVQKLQIRQTCQVRDARIVDARADESKLGESGQILEMLQSSAAYLRKTEIQHFQVLELGEVRRPYVGDSGIAQIHLTKPGAASHVLHSPVRQAHPPQPETVQL
jgi:gluconolactonase